MRSQNPEPLCTSPHCPYLGCTLYNPAPWGEPWSPGRKYTRVPGTSLRWRCGASGCPRLWLSLQNVNLKRSELKKQKIGSCLSPCRCQNSGAAGGALSSSATRSLWPARPWGLRVRKESHLLFIGHPCNAMNPYLDPLKPYLLSVPGSSQTMPDQDLTCIHTSSSIANYHQLIRLFTVQFISKAPQLFEPQAEPTCRCQSSRRWRRPWREAAPDQLLLTTWLRQGCGSRCQSAMIFTSKCFKMSEILGMFIPKKIAVIVLRLEPQHFLINKKKVQSSQPNNKIKVQWFHIGPPPPEHVELVLVMKFLASENGRKWLILHLCAKQRKQTTKTHLEKTTN